MNKIVVSLLTTLFISPILAHDHSPYPETYSAQTLNVLLLKKVSSFQLKLEAETGDRYQDRNYSKFLLGGYYKIKNQQRWGIFYSQQKGLRHSEDWILKDSKWLWKDTSNQTNELYDLVYTKKIRHRGKPLIYNINSTYQVNKTLGLSTLVFKPGLQYFIQKDGLINHSIKLDLPLYISLNYDNENLYKKGVYLAFLHHKTKQFSFGVTAEYLEETWSESSEAERAEPDEPYEKTDTVQKLGVKIILTI